MIEFDEKDIIYHGDYRDDLLSINLAITSYCNYQCSYCCAEMPPVNNNAAFIDYETIINVIDRFFLFNKNEYFIILTGGEPTIHPQFLDILNYLNNTYIDKEIYLSIITNGARSVEYYKNVFENTNNLKFLLRMSIHLEYAKIEHIKDIIILANQLNKNILINLMLHPILKEERENVYNELLKLRKNYKFDISFDELQEGDNFDKLDRRYTIDDFNWIDKINKEFNSLYPNNSSMYISTPSYIVNINNENVSIPKIEFNKAMRENKRSFKDMYCCYGINTFDIWGFGDTTGGACPMFKRYNIYDDFFNWYNIIGYTKCELEQCRCPFNDTLPKFRNENEAKKFVEEYKNKMNSLFISDMYQQLNNYQYKLENRIATLENKINDNQMEILSSKFNKLIDILAWFIPIKKWRNNFRNKIHNM
ncbi:radical SAM protein [Brachyspira pilosicoli]|uniref:Radical SAM protein n=1 Tax=Brachyspira pilosicoli TaxID=52584 RepID=A0A5C8EC44_BRAPL|nr:radical SAM protein [Brachyspira pilosicoli]TXJ35243.1 radical SAM protein [Brachyspira pilosicoli]